MSLEQVRRVIDAETVNAVAAIPLLAAVDKSEGENVRI